jgi:hypothetical protein
MKDIPSNKEKERESLYAELEPLLAGLPKGGEDYLAVRECLADAVEQLSLTKNFNTPIVETLTLPFIRRVYQSAIVNEDSGHGASEQYRSRIRNNRSLFMESYKADKMIAYIKEMTATFMERLYAMKNLDGEAEFLRLFTEDYIIGACQTMQHHFQPDM